MFKTNEYLKFPILQKRFLNEFEMQFFFLPSYLSGMKIAILSTYLSAF